MNFSGGEPFDDLHGSAAFRATPKIRRVFGGASRLFGLRSLYGAEQVKAKRQKSGTFAVGQEAEVTDAYETFRE